MSFAREIPQNRQSQDLFESLLLLSQTVVLSSELLNFQAWQSGSVLETLLYPLLHADFDKNKKTEQELCLFETMYPLRRWNIVDGFLV